MSLFIEYTAKILEIIEGDGKVVIHAKGDGKTVLNYDYANEYIWVFHVIKREDGRYKVSYIKDFVDSYFSAGFTRASQEAIAKAK
ncbi:unnamed protein product [Somion occarium]|uniref:Uncharacterized protein n=1 Tax=Somion occarium TaxID=3059160 RepID=A0ABP1DLM8_9APHY